MPALETKAILGNTDDLEDLENLDIHDVDLGEEEDEEHEAPVQQLPTAATKRATQNAKFEAWVNSKASACNQAAIRKAIEVEDGEVESLKSILAKQESEVIIASPRDYQMELFERAKTQNTIAVLDTGSGKTLIAVLLLRYIIDQELEDRAQGHPKRISFFLVDKVALVFQQFYVLRTNLDHEVEHAVGANGAHLWKKEKWDNLFQNNMIIVCTAAVLQHCLQHSFITMEQINLLIFDEAHHAKKSHPYAKIIGEFYHTMDKHLKRPRIFGMTASPVDVQLDYGIEDVAMDLETLLDSKIATASNLAALHNNYVSRPEEWIVRYHRPSVGVQTELYRTIKSQFGNLPFFKRLLEDSLKFTAELGSWCGDMYWRYAYSEEVEKRQSMQEEQWSNRKENRIPRKNLEEDIARLKGASELLSKHIYDEPSADLKDLSSKVLELHRKVLQPHFELPCGTRCLIFVERRFTAHLLKAIFDHLGGPNLKPGVLVGSNANTINGYQASIKKQIVTLAQFRSGELNCLFATTVAEEGLDIQSCNLVVRFDPCKTMIQYIQSRGRARHRNSKLYHMIEQGNSVQDAALREVRKGEVALTEFCSKLPKDRLLQVSEESKPEIGSKSEQVYIEKATGAKLTYDFSLVVLAHFVAALPHDQEEVLSINYVCSLQAGKYVYEVILPVHSPIRRASGKPHRTKRTAKRSAAFAMCLQLRKEKLLNEYLLPIYAKQLPAMSQARLALSSKRSNVYPLQLKPSIWAIGRGTIPTELFLTVIYLNGVWDRPVQPFGLFTRMLLPDLPQFPLYRLSGDGTNVVIKSITKGITVDASLVDRSTIFTLVLMKDIFNKTFEKDPAAMSYWLVPLLNGCETLSALSDSPQELIDYELLERVSVGGRAKWTKEMGSEDLCNKFLVDPFHGGKRYITRCIIPELRAFDPVPKEVRSNTSESIISSSVSLWRSSKQKRTWNPDQPVLEAEALMHRLNVLASPNHQEQEAITKCYVCPEPLDISQLPVQVVGMGIIFPAIVHRIESYLIALEVGKDVGVTLKPDLALEAITKDSDNTDDTTGEKINFQRGMGPNYERLEFLGDSFLKMATTMSIFIHYAPKQDEFAMHCTRMVMLCNKNLLKSALERDLPKFIRSSQFSRRNWYPENLNLIDGKKIHVAKKGEVEQRLADKTIADVCEALIGAALLTHYTSGYDSCSQFDDAVRAVTEFAKHEDHLMKCWTDYKAAYTIPSWQMDQSTASQQDMAAKVEQKHDYHFDRPRLLRSAFTHPSCPMSWEGIPTYERLEFLGDALLDMTAVMYLYMKYPGRDPQWLTEHKMAMVSNKFLGAVAVKVGLHKHLRHNHAELQSQITSFVEDLDQAERQSQGNRDYWTDVVKDPPKCLPDIVESYVGAMFVDSGFNYAVVQKFFDDHIQWFFEDMSLYDTFASSHPMSRLQALLSTSMGCCNQRILAHEIPSDNGLSSTTLAGVMVHDEIVGEGQAKSTKAAKIKAAIDALKVLEGIAPFEFRQKYGCDCRTPGTSERTEADRNVDTAI